MTRKRALGPYKTKKRVYYSTMKYLGFYFGVQGLGFGRVRSGLQGFRVLGLQGCRMLLGL